MEQRKMEIIFPNLDWVHENLDILGMEILVKSAL